MKLASIGLALTFLTPASVAAAQSQPQERGRAERPAAARDARQRGLEAPRPAALCIPWCNWDSNPCDPPEYKKADGRCFQDG